MKLDPRHLGAVLAGLRLVQQQMKPVPNGSDVDEILTNGDTIEPLDLEEINQLCERLNFSPYVAVGDKPEQKDAKPPEEPEYLMVGNPFDGFSIVGPFATEDEADAYGEKLQNGGNWWRCGIEAPE